MEKELVTRYQPMHISAWVIFLCLKLMQLAMPSLLLVCGIIHCSSGATASNLARILTYFLALFHVPETGKSTGKQSFELLSSLTSLLSCSIAIGLLRLRWRRCVRSTQGFLRLSISRLSHESTTINLIRSKSLWDLFTLASQDELWRSQSTAAPHSAPFAPLWRIYNCLFVGHAVKSETFNEMTTQGHLCDVVEPNSALAIQ